MRYTLLSCISSLLLSSVVSATDCVTSFDQSCASRSYDQQAVDNNAEDRQQEIEDAKKRAEEHYRAVRKAEQEQARAEAEWRKEEREEDRLIVEVEQTKAARRAATALEGIRRGY
jgi:hypothetical protein